MTNKKQKTGIELIAEERKRQREKLWGDYHDDNHEPGVLAKAGGCYIAFAAFQLEYGTADFDQVPDQWPFGNEWWKPSNDPIRNQQKGAAMVAAEMDRSQRKK